MFNKPPVLLSLCCLHLIPANIPLAIPSHPCTGTEKRFLMKTRMWFLSNWLISGFWVLGWVPAHRKITVSPLTDKWHKINTLIESVLQLVPNCYLYTSTVHCQGVAETARRQKIRRTNNRGEEKSWFFFLSKAPFPAVQKPPVSTVWTTCNVCCLLVPNQVKLVEFNLPVLPVLVSFPFLPPSSMRFSVHP